MLQHKTGLSNAVNFYQVIIFVGRTILPPRSFIDYIAIVSLYRHCCRSVHLRFFASFIQASILVFMHVLKSHNIWVCSFLFGYSSGNFILMWQKKEKLYFQYYIPCLAHLRFSVGKSVGRVAHRDSFACILLFESICNDRSIIIRLQISLK